MEDCGGQHGDGGERTSAEREKSGGRGGRRAGTSGKRSPGKGANANYDSLRAAHDIDRTHYAPRAACWGL